MVTALRYSWCLVVIYAEFISGCWSSAAAGTDHSHHQPGATTITTRPNSNLQLLHVEVQLQESNHFLCRTLRRCLLIHDPPTPDSGFVPYSPYPPPPSPTIPVDAPVALPTLPSDSDSSGPNYSSPPPPRTNPSSLLTPPFASSTSGVGAAMSKSTGGSSNIAGKVGISAGVGATGVAVLLLGLLYYFRPDIFMCCKTCVRVQIFHHNSGHNASKK